MTLTPLKLKSNTRFFTNFMLSLKSSKKILIIISILQLLGLPLLACVFVSVAAKEGGESISDGAFMLISIFCLCAAVLCGIFVAVQNFSYLNKKSQVDMVCALPIKKKYKFLSDFLSGLAVYVVPYIAGCILCNLIISGGRVCITELAEVFSAEKSLMTFIIQGEFAGLLIMTMLYTLTVLVLCCCGTLFESIMNIFMINALIPGGIAVIAAMFFANLYGVPIFETVIPVLGYTSPIGAAIYIFYVLENQVYYVDDYMNISGALYGKWVLFFLLATILYFGLCMFLYHRRKAEDVSKPYVFKLLYYILVTVITMAISLFARYDFSTVFPVIIFSFIVYMIFEVITNRGFRKIWKSLIRYGVTMTGVLILCVAATGTHGFGVEGKIPPVSMVSSVEVSYGGIDDVMWQRFDSDYYYCRFGYENNSVKYSDKEIIKKVTEVQKQAIETYRSGKYENYSEIGEIYYNGYIGSEYMNGDISDIYNYPAYHVKFRYNHKTGGTTTREYTLSFAQMRELFILDDTEELAQNKADRLMDRIKTTEYINNYRTESYSYTMNFFKNSYGGSNFGDISLTKSEAQELVNCYKQDYIDASLEELETSRVICYILGDVPIRESFKRTAEFIKKQHPDLESSYENISATVHGKLYQPKGYKSFRENNLTASFGYAEKLEGYSHNLTNSETTELLKYASPCYISDDECYVMEIFGEYYVILPEYTDKAEEIYNSGKIIDNNSYTFEKFMNDLRACYSADEYINEYSGDDFETFYNDINKAFDMRYFYYSEDGSDGYVPDGDEEKEYSLLKKFFGFVSEDEYTTYLKNSGVSYNEETVSKEWEEYEELFPTFASRRMKLLDYATEY